jgi:lipoprotein
LARFLAIAASTAFSCFNKSSLRDEDEPSVVEDTFFELDLTDALFSACSASLNIILFSSLRGDISSEAISEDDDPRPAFSGSESSSLSPLLPFSLAATFLSFLRLGC